MDINEKIQNVYNSYFAERVEQIIKLNNNEINRNIKGELNVLSINLYISFECNSEKGIQDAIKQFDNYLEEIEKEYILNE